MKIEAREGGGLTVPVSGFTINAVVGLFRAGQKGEKGRIPLVGQACWGVLAQGAVADTCIACQD